MISGKRLALLLLLLVAPTRAPDSVELGAIEPGALELDAKLAELARPAPQSTPFVDARSSKLTTRPLVVRGTMELAADGALVRRIESPYRETTTVRGDEVRVERAGRKPRRFSLNRAPELRGLLASFGALLGGDRATLEKHFEVSLAGGEGGWTLTLAPREPRARKHVSAVLVTGVADTPRCIHVHERRGSNTITLLGSPVLSAPPATHEIAAYCSGSP